MEEQFSRTRMLMGSAAIKTLEDSRVAVFGVGGVGGYAVEALARSGIGALDLFDNDQVNISNLNRQIIALHSTIGQYKVDVAARRIADINPRCNVSAHKLFYLPDNADETDLTPFDYVVDCIDTVSAKLELIRRCHALQIPIISCMGAANKMNPSRFRAVDISETSVDPLAKIIRKKLRKENILHFKVVWSDEEPLKPIADSESPNAKDSNRPTPASNAFVPAAAGLVAAAEVIKDLLHQAGTFKVSTDE